MAVTIRKGRALESLTMTPLIDVVFLLLIFFLVATKFAEEERELPVNLPDASEAQPLIAKPRELFVNIDEHGRYFVSGKVLSLAELETVFREAWASNPGNTSVILRADERCRLQAVVAAINACKKANIDDYRLAAQKPTSTEGGP
ncbi:biopolymer transporter ExbD [Thermostilla marina]